MCLMATGWEKKVEARAWGMTNWSGGFFKHLNHQMCDGCNIRCVMVARCQIQRLGSVFDLLAGILGWIPWRMV
jgi:hypothetical protein